MKLLNITYKIGMGGMTKEIIYGLRDAASKPTHQEVVEKMATAMAIPTTDIIVKHYEIKTF